MSVVVDYYRPKGRTFMDCLVTQGVSGIARYLTNDASDPRQVTDSEIADAHAAGLEVHFYFEMNPTFPAYFTYAQGAEDCRQAVERLRELGAPEGTVVYFAVDAPPTRVHPETLDEYFNGVESMATPQITPGIYGYAEHIEHARANFPNVGKHLAQTYGTPRYPLDLWQHEQVAMCGVAVDLNACSVAGWRPKEEYVAGTHPIYLGESVTVVTVNPNDPDPEKRVARMSAIFRWPDGRERAIERKAYGKVAGLHPFVIYPPADPDADVTEDLDAQPGVFIVAVSPL